MNDNMVNVTCPLNVGAVNEWLAPYGLHIAPLPAPEPPKQTEAERLVEIARSLPSEATTGWDRMADCNVDSDGDMWVGNTYYRAATFRTILLGVMAEYVGTETFARVFGSHSGPYEWNNGSGTLDCAPDILTAYAACCQAIAARRKGGK